MNYMVLDSWSEQQLLVFQFSDDPAFKNNMPDSTAAPAPAPVDKSQDMPMQPCTGALQMLTIMHEHKGWGGAAMFTSDSALNAWSKCIPYCQA